MEKICSRKVHSDGIDYSVSYSVIFFSYFIDIITEKRFSNAIQHNNGLFATNSEWAIINFFSEVVCCPILNQVMLLLAVVSFKNR